MIYIPISVSMKNIFMLQHCMGAYFEELFLVNNPVFLALFCNPIFFNFFCLKILFCQNQSRVAFWAWFFLIKKNMSGRLSSYYVIRVCKKVEKKCWPQFFIKGWGFWCQQNIIHHEMYWRCYSRMNPFAYK